MERTNVCIPYCVTLISDVFLDSLINSNYSAEITALAKDNTSKGTLRLKHRWRANHFLKVNFFVASKDDLQMFDLFLYFLRIILCGGLLRIPIKGRGI